MNMGRCCLALALAILFSFYTITAFAAQITFQKEYTYQASEADSKLTCRTIALEQVKRLLLEELGTYLESTFEDQITRDKSVTKSEIITLTAGIVQTEIIAEEWDGHTYWLKAKIVADPDQVIKSIDSLRKDLKKAKELEQASKRVEQLLNEVKSLRKQLTLTKDDIRKLKQYNRAVRELSALDWKTKGFTFLKLGNYKKAIDAFNNGIELNPDDASLFMGRGMLYSELGNYYRAIGNFNKAIELDPKYVETYLYRGNVYYELEDYQQAIRDLNKAIELDPEDGAIYVLRGLAYDILGDHKQAIQSYDKAIELDPEDGAAYYNRGRAYYGLEDYQQAIRDYNKAIELNPDDASAYYYRGLAYLVTKQYILSISDFNKALKINPKLATAYHSRGWVYRELRNYKQSMSDFKDAARLGYKPAQDFLTSKGIQLYDSKESGKELEARNGTYRDEHYIAYANGIVRDTMTGLEWVAGPDRGTTWYEAKRWVESLNINGVGWRMPTIEELKTLYERGKGKRNMTPLLKTTGTWVWSGETKDSSKAWGFYFSAGVEGLDGPYNQLNNRAFAVRSRK